MKKRYFWIREDYWLNIITMTMIALSIGVIYAWGQELYSVQVDLYQMLPSGYENHIMPTAYRLFLERSGLWHLVLVVGTAMISFVLFRDMKKEETKEWIFSLPLSGKKMIWHQWFRGMAAYTLPHLVYAAGIMIVYSRNISVFRARYLMDDAWQALLSAEQPWQYGKVFLMLWLWATACYSIFFLLQIACRNQILALSSGFGIILTPLYSSIIFHRLISVLPFEAALETWSKAVSRWEQWFVIVVNPRYEDTKYLYGWDDLIGGDFDVAGYIIHPDQLVVIVVMTAACIGFASYYFKHMSDQTQEGVFSVLWIRYVILEGFSFCISIGITTNLIYYQGVGGVGFFAAGSLVLTAVMAAAIDRIMRKKGY